MDNGITNEILDNVLERLSAKMADEYISILKERLRAAGEDIAKMPAKSFQVLEFGLFCHVTENGKCLVNHKNIAQRLGVSPMTIWKRIKYWEDIFIDGQPVISIIKKTINGEAEYYIHFINVTNVNQKKEFANRRNKK